MSNCRHYRVEKERVFCDVLAEAEDIVEYRACNTRLDNYITLLRKNIKFSLALRIEEKVEEALV